MEERIDCHERGRRRRRLLGRSSEVALIAGLCCITMACSVVMAARQPGQKDLAVLERGTPRSVVRGELGVPIESHEATETTKCHETYSFEQGYSGPTKAGRAIFHLAADVFTLGLWEIIGTPTELHFDGTEVNLEVSYDENDRVDSVCVYGGHEVVTADTVVPHDEFQRQLDPAASSVSAPPSPAEPEGSEDGWTPAPR